MLINLWVKPPDMDDYLSVTLNDFIAEQLYLNRELARKDLPEILNEKEDEIYDR